jgi:hypothetical protein
MTYVVTSTASKPNPGDDAAHVGRRQNQREDEHVRLEAPGDYGHELKREARE